MKTDQHTQGSVFGGILLVSGCCIGAGMLGLPVLSALAGFKPSFLMFLISWLFMVCTGLLLLEVNLWFKEDVNIVSMASRTLGFAGKAVAWGVFLFLFYCLMVAYVSASGALFSDFVHELTGATLSATIGSAICTLMLGVFLYFGTLASDHFNRVLMLGLVATYLILVAVGIGHVNLDLLEHHDWSMSPYVLPVMIVSFGFHNLVPSLTTYLNRDAKRLRTTIIAGSLIPLFVYLLWEFLILGLIPVDGAGGFREALDKGEMATQTLKIISGIPLVVTIAQYFAFFAIITSFIGVALSFVDFLADGLRIKKSPSGKVLLCSLVLIPPLIFAAFYPQVFLMALNYAGGIGAVILFGILPAAMVWAGRYHHQLSDKPFVPGGKTLLVLVVLFSCAIVALQLL